MPPKAYSLQPTACKEAYSRQFTAYSKDSFFAVGCGLPTVGHLFFSIPFYPIPDILLFDVSFTPD